MNLRQKAAKGVAWSAIENLGTQAIYFVVFLVLARLLQPEEFGLVSLAGVFISFMMVFADQGLSDAIVQRQDLEPEHLDTAFWINLGICALLAIFTFAAAGSVSSFFHQPQLKPIIAWLSLSFLFNGFSSVQQSLLRRQLAFRALAVRSLVATFASGIVGVVMALMGFGVWSLVAQQLINRVLAILGLWWASDWRPGFKVSAKHFQELFSFGINILGGSVLIFLNIRSDDFLIGYFLGPVALGYYTIAYRFLVAMTQIINTTIRQVAFPMFSRLQQEPDRLQQTFFKATQLVSFITFPAYLGMAALAPEIVRTMFGAQWIPSIPVMQILAFIGIPQATFTLSGLVLVAMGKPSWNLRIMFLNTVVNIAGFLIAVHWGIIAVAASFVIRCYVLSPVQLWAIYKVIRINIATYFNQFFTPLFGSLMMVIAVFGAKYFLTHLINAQILLAVCVAIGAGIYAATLLLIAPKLFWQIVDFTSLTLGISKLKKT